MKFQDYATQKAAALVAELNATWSEKSARELQAFHKALETAAHAAQTALATAAVLPSATPLRGRSGRAAHHRGSGPGRSRARSMRTVPHKTQIDALQKDLAERSRNQESCFASSLGELHAR